MQVSLGLLQSDMVQGPPESVRMLALTAKMYAMVRNVAVPALSSVVKLVLLSVILNLLPTLLLATYEFNRLWIDRFLGSESVSIETPETNFFVF